MALRNSQITIEPVAKSLLSRFWVQRKCLHFDGLAAFLARPVSCCVWISCRGHASALIWSPCNLPSAGSPSSALKTSRHTDCSSFLLPELRGVPSRKASSTKSPNACARGPKRFSFRPLPSALSACSHPESGYVQGMNDLVTPFYTVFLSEHLSDDLETWQPDFLPMVCVIAGCMQVHACTQIHTQLSLCVAFL